jgi:hypothetical protein
MKAETLWKKAKQWCVAQQVPYTYAGYWCSILNITTSPVPTMNLNRHGEWLIFY